MALINKIRQRSGLAVGIVAIGLGFFIVGSDILGPNSAILGKNKTDVGEIAGQTIDVTEYQDEIDMIKNRYAMNYQRTPTENEMFTIRQQAWDYLINKIAFDQEYEALGLTVSEEEEWDMIQGNNVRPEIQQSFTDPNTGEFHREQVVNFLRSLKQAPREQQASWYLFERELKPSRLRIKYDNLLLKTEFATDIEAKQQYDYDNTVAEIKYLYVPYYAVNDSLVDIKDADLKAYLKAHSNEYKVEESRDFSYISIPIVPSAQDSMFFREQMNDLATDFKETTEDSIFARINSDGATFFNRFTIDQLPTVLQNNYSSLSKGDVRGPYFENGMNTLYKISDIYEDTVYSAKASHILIKWENESDQSKQKAKREAQGILNQLRAGADFETMAIENSADGSASNGGDLGWFGEGRMVPPFQEAVFNATREGLINRLIETQFGYHIIKVTGTKQNTKFAVASVEREITASDETQNKAFRKADYFAAQTKSFDAFFENAENDSLPIFTATEIGKNDRRFNDISNGRSVIQWAYNDISVGDVSPVKELDDQYIVAVLTKITEEGTATIDDVREQLEAKVKNEKKGAIINEKLKQMTGTLEEISSQYGDDARVSTSSDLKLSSNSLPGVGFVPEAIGATFSLEQGERSEPIQVENGVIIIEMIAITKAPEIADYSAYKNQIEQKNVGRISYEINEIIREFADIQDRRYRYF